MESGHYLASNAILAPGGQFTVQPPGTWINIWLN